MKKTRDALKSTMIVTSCVRLSENLVVLLNEPVCDGRFRADSICNNPFPEWQSRIGMRGSFYERSVSVMSVHLFSEYIFFGKNFRSNESMITRMA